MRTGIVGCGAISQVHLDTLSESADTKLVACCDIDEKKAKAAAEQFGASVYTDLEEMLQKESIDVLHICTPHYLHIQMAQMAARYCVHIFTEKPPAITVKDAKALLEVEKSVRLGVCFQNRYNKENKYIKELLDDGALGAVKGGRGMVFWKRTKAYYDTGAWRGKWETEGGGVLINQSIHTLDLLVYFLGQPISVQAKMSNYTMKDCIEVEDTFDAHIRFEKGTAIFYATNAYEKDAPVQVEIVGDKGSVFTKGNRVELSLEEETARSFPVEQVNGKSYWGASHKECIFDFYSSLKNGTPFLNDYSNVYPTIQLMHSAYESAKKGQEVIIKELFS